MWTSFFNNKLVRWLLVILSILLFIYGVFKAGEYAQKKITETIADVTNQMTQTIQKNLQQSLDEHMGALQNELDNNLSSINGKFDEQQKAIKNTQSKLDGIGDVWLRVERVRTDQKHIGNAQGTGSQTPGSSGGSDGTYYAKLPAENVQFLKGEAFRADQCAVRLNAAQQVIVQYKGAFVKYQELVEVYLNAAQLDGKTK